MNNTLSKLVRNLIVLTSIVLMISLCKALYSCGKKNGRGDSTTIIKTDTIRETIVDTIKVVQPPITSTNVVRDTVILLNEKHVSQDSLGYKAQLDVVQKHYKDSAYEVWVSGPIAPSLDSLVVYNKTELITITKQQKVSRWGLSIGIGAAVTPWRVEPGVFVGVTYTFCTF